MDNYGHDVNLGDVDVVENTQPSSNDCIGSQVPSTPEVSLIFPFTCVQLSCHCFAVLCHF